MWKFIIGSAPIIFGLPFFFVTGASLYSKFLPMKVQGTPTYTYVYIYILYIQLISDWPCCLTIPLCRYWSGPAQVCVLLRCYPGPTVGRRCAGIQNLLHSHECSSRATVVCRGQ